MNAKRTPNSEGKRPGKKPDPDPGREGEKARQEELKLARSELKKAKGEIAKLQNRLAAEARTLDAAKDRAKERSGQTRRRYESRMAEAGKRHDEALEQVKMKHEAELVSLRSELGREYLRQVEAIGAESERLLEEALGSHADALSAQERRHEQEMAAVKEHASQAFLIQEQKHARDMQVLRAEMEQKMEEALSEAEKRHRAEILGMVVRHGSEIQRLEGEKTALATSLEGLRRKFSAPDSTPRKKTDPPPPLRDPSPGAGEALPPAAKKPEIIHSDAWRLNEGDHITYEPGSDKESVFWKKGTKKER